MTVKLPNTVTRWSGLPSYPAQVRNYYLNHYEDLSTAQIKELHELAETCVQRADISNLPDWKFTAADTLKLVEDLEGRNGQDAQKVARDRILGDKVAISEPLTKAEQKVIVDAIKEHSPLAPLERLIEWLLDKWEKVVKPILEQFKKLFDVLMPWFEQIAKDLPEAMEVLRKDIIEPYLRAYKGADDILQKFKEQFTSDINGNSKDYPGMPYRAPPNLDITRDQPLITVSRLPFYAEQIQGIITYRMMQEYQLNNKTGFYNDLHLQNFLFSGNVGVDLQGMANRIVRGSRMVGRQASGLARGLSDIADDVTSAEIPDWFIARTDPRVDESGHFDYFLRRY